MCDVVGKALALAGVAAGDRCLESAKSLIPLMLEVLVSDVSGWNKALIRSYFS